MPATHPLARYAELANSRREPFRTREPRRLGSTEASIDEPREREPSKPQIVVPRQRQNATLASEQ